MIEPRALAWPAAVICAALLAAWLWGAVPAAWILGAGLAALALWQARGLAQLSRWAGAALDAPVPESRGLWGAAFARIHRRVRMRAAVERELSHTLERFRDAAEAMPDGVVVLDAQDRIRWANRRAAQRLAIAPRTDIGAPLGNFVREPRFLRYLAVGDFSADVQMPSPREPGVMLSMQLFPFGVDERLLICRDITLQDAVLRRHRDFIANVSHELKTPLTVVSGFIETLQDMPLDERARSRYLGMMAEQAASMRRLVADLLTLSALESEGGLQHEVSFEVEPLMAELAAEAQALSRGAQGAHLVEAQVLDPARVTGNREELASAFANLVSNAIRYTPAGGRVALSWRVEPDGSGVFAVQDSGIGIAPEHLPRLTERFYRVDRSRSRATGGTGLGLAIVKHILARHKATLEVESVVGEGSRFSARLPASRVAVHQ